MGGFAHVYLYQHNVSIEQFNPQTLISKGKRENLLVGQTSYFDGDYCQGS